MKDQKKRWIKNLEESMEDEISEQKATPIPKLKALAKKAKTAAKDFRKSWNNMKKLSKPLFAQGAVNASDMLDDSENQSKIDEIIEMMDDVLDEMMDTRNEILADE